VKLRWLIGGTALSLVSGWALAQRAPESLLPPGFDNPPPAAVPAPPPPAATSAPSTSGASRPASGGSSEARSGGASSSSTFSGASSVPGVSFSVGGGITGADSEALARLPTLEELEKMTPEEFEAALGLKPSFDIPAGARRSTSRVGVIDPEEGGYADSGLRGVRPSLARSVLRGNRGQILSRWGHILLRRSLATRLDAPEGMNAADFAGLRAAVLVRMGEMEAARALVQDVDIDNYTPILTNAAFDAYIGTADYTGMCPMLIARSDSREDPPWEAANDICSAVRGDGRAALRSLDRALNRKQMASIDLLLAQRYAGAAGQTRRAVTVEWENVDSLTPFSYGLAIALGLRPPDRLVSPANRRYAATAALAPMVGLVDRAAAADRAAGRGVLSSAAMVDLYGQIYSSADIDGEPAERAELLRRAYVLADFSARSTEMQSLWNSAPDPQQRYSRQVLTAFAAARLPVDAMHKDQAGDLIASMLAAGLDRNAARWANIVDEGSQAWGLLAVGAPGGTVEIGSGAVDSFFDDDDSVELRKSAFLLAGLAGLGRIDEATKTDFESRLEIDLDRRSRWSLLIDMAARQRRQAMVGMLAGLGMQGTSWDKMTPRHLYHIVSALRRVGLEAEARMIAAEAVARG
jgi:hypothetical protein